MSLFFTVKLVNAYKILWYTAFSCWAPVPFSREKNFARADFDHMLGGNFRTVNTCHAISKTTLQFVIFVKIHLNTWREPKIYLLQNRYQKFSWWMHYPGSCPWVKWGERGEENTLVRMYITQDYPMTTLKFTVVQMCDDHRWLAGFLLKNFDVGGTKLQLRIACNSSGYKKLKHRTY